MKNFTFLSLEDVLEIHKNQIELYGGTNEMRSTELLQSALAQPQAGFAGQYLHSTIYEMAAAYAFHICQNHPFVDGNKRTALTSSLVFLEFNGITILDPENKLIDLMLGVSQGKISKQEIANFLKKL